MVGACAIEACGDAYPETTHEVCMNADAVLFAAVGDLKYDNNPTLKMRPETGLLAMRKKLGLFANVRPVATFDCLLHKSPLKDELLRGADFVVIRELTGGMYFGEKYQDNDKAYDTDIYTRPEIERILKVAFEMAMTRKKHLTVVDKANVLASSRLWRQIAKEMEPHDDGLYVHRQCIDACADGAYVLRCNRDGEYLRRYPDGRDQLYHGFYGSATFFQPRRAHPVVRTCSWFMASG